MNTCSALYCSPIQNKEKEAKENAKRREKELGMQRRAQIKGGNGKAGFAGGFGSDSSSQGVPQMSHSASSSSMSQVSARESVPLAAPQAMAASVDTKKFVISFLLDCNGAGRVAV
jgi:hypothetical protein